MTREHVICRAPDEVFKAAHEITKAAGNLPLRVSWTTEKPKRTELQNRCLHKWFQIISQATGSAPAEVKAECNLTYGVPIKRRDDQEWAGAFGHLFDSLNWASKLKALRVLDIPVTRSMTTKQLSEYSEQMQRDYAERDIALPFKEDLG